MGRKCSVPGCKTGYTSANVIRTAKLSVYGFPKDPNELQKWLSRLPNEISADSITRNMGVCSLHWPPDVPLMRRARHMVPSIPPSIFPDVQAQRFYIPRTTRTTLRNKFLKGATAVNRLDDMIEIIDMDQLEQHSQQQSFLPQLGTNQKRDAAGSTAPDRRGFMVMTDPASEDGTRGLINCSTDDEAVLPEVKLEEPMYDSDTEEESNPHCSLERRLVPYSSEAKLAELLALPNYDNEPRPEYTPELDVECQAIKTEVDDGEEVFNLNGAEENRLASCTADQFDSIGMTIANKLRSLPCEQSIIAEKIFNEVMCEAESGNLTAESTFVLIKPDNDIDETGLS